MATHQSRRALVTGGAGFIGSHLVEALVARGDRVTVVDDHRNVTRDNLAAVASSIEQVDGDCSVAAALIGEARFDRVYHLAAPAYVPPSVDDPIADLRNNVEQTLVILQAIRALADKPRMIHVSSAAIYGEPAQQPTTEDHPPAPVAPYGVDKFAAEEHVRVAATLHDIPAVVLRYFPAYGPRQRKQVVYDLITKALANPDAIEVFGTGQEMRDLVFVEDVVAGTLVAADHAPARGEAYNVGSGTMVTIADVVREVLAALSLAPTVTFTGSVRPGDSSRMGADITRLRFLGYAPSITLADGIARTAAWVKESA